MDDGKRFRKLISYRSLVILDADGSRGDIEQVELAAEVELAADVVNHHNWAAACTFFRLFISFWIGFIRSA